MSSAGLPAAAVPADEVCLGFVNTRYWRGSAAPTDDLPDMVSVLAWAAAQGGADAAMVAAASDWIEAEPKRATAAHAAVIELREVVFAAFAGVAAGEGVPAAALARLNAAVAAAPARRRLAAAGGGCAWEVAAKPGVLALLAPALWSAADLLVGSRRARLRQCANPRCGWVFLDDSKSGTRRWCTMSACGNRAKAARHYARKRGAV